MRLLPKLLVANERRRAIVITVAWGLSIAWIYTSAIITRSELATTDLVLVGGVCLLSGVALGDLASALLGYIAAIAIGTATTYFLYTLALSLWSLPAADNIALSSISLVVMFKAVFPFPFLGYMVASLIGSVIGEKYLS